MVQNLRKMIALKSKKALTIIEVLVAVILTAIVMLHGTIFFIATWRLNAESKDYNTVLNNVVLNLENYIAKPYNSAVTIAESEYMIKTEKLRDKYDVTYTLTKSTGNFTYGGFYYMISSARWRYGGDANSDNKINIKTVCAQRWEHQ